MTSPHRTTTPLTCPVCIQDAQNGVPLENCEQHLWMAEALRAWQTPTWRTWKRMPREQRLQERYHRRND